MIAFPGGYGTLDELFEVLTVVAVDRLPMQLLRVHAIAKRESIQILRDPKMKVIIFIMPILQVLDDGSDSNTAGVAFDYSAKIVREFSQAVLINLMLLFFATSLYLLTTLGIGLLISTPSQAQQQVMMSALLAFWPRHCVGSA